MADESNTTSETADGDTQGVHRLRDIVVQEVSLVDRAANKRRFLVVKRSDMADDGKPKKPGSPAKRTGAAAKRRAEKKQKAKAPASGPPRRQRAPGASGDEAEDAEKARGRRPPSTRDDGEPDDEEEDDDVEAAKANDDDDSEEDDADVDTDKADDDDDDDDEAEKADDGEDDDDDEDETAKADDEEDDDEDEDDADKAAAPPASGDKPAEKADDEPDDEGDEEDDESDGDTLVLPAAAKTALLRMLAQALERLMGVANRVKEADESDDDTATYVPDDVEGELEDIGELLENVSERLPSGKAAATKADVTKAGRRMAKDRLERFQKALEMLAHVLKELTEAKQPAPPPGDRARPADKTRKAGGTPGLGELVASVGELTKLVKRQQDELATQRKTRATSNAISVEGGRRREPQDVAWPLDMNRPISRETVSKSASFYEE